MARLLTLDAVTVGLRNTLLNCLRDCDEGLLLPQASQSSESGLFKNILFRLSGDVPGVKSAVFSHDLFAGLSMVQIKEYDAEVLKRILDDSSARATMLATLAASIKSEAADPDLSIGPKLECDELERDLESDEWICGFDSPSSFCGIFKAGHSRVTEGGARGTARVHEELFLVCKAGAGVSASTLYARLQAALAKPGATLDSVLADGGAVGATALRRLASAGSRNRQRIMFEVSKTLGISLNSVGDQASRNKYRCAVVDVDVIVNTLRKMEGAQRSTWQMTHAVDGTLSRGVASLSNLSDGVVLFLNGTQTKISLSKSEAWSSVPYSTIRLSTAKTGVERALANKGVTKDIDWIRRRFAWTNRKHVEDQPDIAPFAFDGSHETESFVSSFLRELGLANFKVVRLRPELVSVSGVEAAKLRILVKGLAARV